MKQKNQRKSVTSASSAFYSPEAMEEASVMMVGLNPERILQGLVQLQYQQTGERLTDHRSQITHHASPITHHPSLITHHSLPTSSRLLNAKRKR